MKGLVSILEIFRHISLLSDGNSLRKSLYYCSKSKSQLVAFVIFSTSSEMEYETSLWVSSGKKSLVKAQKYLPLSYALEKLCFHSCDVPILFVHEETDVAPFLCVTRLNA